MALRVVQDEVGYLTPGWMSAVAYYLKVEVTKIYEVATWYVSPPTSGALSSQSM